MIKKTDIGIYSLSSNAAPTSENAIEAHDAGFFQDPVVVPRSFLEELKQTKNATKIAILDTADAMLFQISDAGIYINQEMTALKDAVNLRLQNAFADPDPENHIPMSSACLKWMFKNTIDRFREESLLDPMKAYIVDTANAFLQQIVNAKFCIGRDLAILKDQVAQKLQNAFADPDPKSAIMAGMACLKWIGSQFRRLAKGGVNQGMLPVPQTKLDLSAHIIIQILVEQANTGAKKVSITSTQVRDILAGRWGGKKVARKIGIDVMRRVILICDAIGLRRRPNDGRGTWELIAEGPELLEAQVISLPYRNPNGRPDRRKGGTSPSKLDTLIQSVCGGSSGNQDHNASSSSDTNYNIPRGGGTDRGTPS